MELLNVLHTIYDLDMTFYDSVTKSDMIYSDQAMRFMTTLTLSSLV